MTANLDYSHLPFIVAGAPEFKLYEEKIKRLDRGGGPMNLVASVSCFIFYFYSMQPKWPIILSTRGRHENGNYTREVSAK